MADAGGVPPPPLQSLRARGSPPGKTPEPPWSVLLGLLVFSVDVDRASGTPGSRSTVQLTCPVSSGGESAITEGRGSLPQGGSSGVRGRSPCVCNLNVRTSNQSEERIQPPEHSRAPLRPSTTRKREHRGRHHS